jgi:hypothetical protein
MDLTVDEILDRGADLIDLHGWTRGKFRDTDTGALCLIGAMQQVGNFNTISAAIIFIEGSRGINDSIVYWNDHDCISSTQATELLRTQAKCYREVHQ